ncbi:MAG: hypothetical protein ACYS8Z_20650, partial [Planctomycetota bacterium]
MNRNRIILILFCAMLLVAGAGDYKDRGDWTPRDDLLLVGDENEVVWYNLDSTWTSDESDAADANTVSIRASGELEESYRGRMPTDSGEPNSVLMTPGDIDSQWVWAVIDSNLIIIDDGDANDVNIALPTLTPGSRIFVDANGFPLYEDNDNAYFDDVNDFAGFALGGIASGTRPNNYIQVYYLLNFDPDLLNVSVGWARDDVLVGPNNVRIGEGAGGLLREGFQNSLGGKGSGLGLVDETDNSFWGYQSGMNIETPAVRDEAYVAANNTTVLWFDSDWNLLDEENLGGGTTCTSIAVDSTGIVV